MRMSTRFSLSIAIIFLFQIEATRAQQVIATAGGIAVASDSSVAFKSVQRNHPSNQGDSKTAANSGSATFTVGQILFHTYQSDSGSAAHGVQQSYEISVIIGKEEKEIMLTGKAYPNPANEILYLEIYEIPLDNTYYRIMDLQGKYLKSARITGPETEISLGELPGASFFIQVISQDQLLKTFQIIKN